MFCEIGDNVFDVADIDLTCLLADGGDSPTTREEFYQLIVDKLCDALLSTDPTDPESIYFNLPPCLQYVDGDGNTIMMADLPDYVDLIGNAVCDIQDSIAIINTDIDSLDVRVTALENATPGGTSFPTVTTQCASGPTPGITLPIQQAFYNLETKFCTLSQVLGTVAQLNAVIATECTDLDTEATLMDPDLEMRDIPGWVITPTTLSQSINNIWLTICDMRSKIIECCAAPVLTCATVSPSNLTISNVTTTSATASWFVPSYGSGEPPVQYIVNVFNETAGNPSGAPVITVTVSHPTTFTNLNTAGLTENKNYIVQVSAVYSCGESTVTQVSSVVRISAASLCLYVYETNNASTVDTCSGVSYTKLNKRTSVRLQNTATSAPVVNTGAAITVTVQYALTNQCGATSNVTQAIIIPNGSSEAYFDYVQTSRAVCVGTGLCANVTRVISCVVSVSGTTATLCSGPVAMCPPLP
jgi:hypothetical protein